MISRSRVRRASSSARCCFRSHGDIAPPACPRCPCDAFKPPIQLRSGSAASRADCGAGTSEGLTACDTRHPSSDFRVFDQGIVELQVASDSFGSPPAAAAHLVDTGTRLHISGVIDSQPPAINSSMRARSKISSALRVESRARTPAVLFLSHQPGLFEHPKRFAYRPSGNSQAFGQPGFCKFGPGLDLALENHAFDFVLCSARKRGRAKHRNTGRRGTVQSDGLHH